MDGQNAEDVYICTKRARIVGHTLAVILPKDWPFMKLDMVDFQLQKMGSDAWFSEKKVIRQTANSLCIYINSKWKIERDDMVTFKVSLRHSYGRNTGRKTERRDSGSFEV